MPELINLGALQLKFLHSKETTGGSIDLRSQGGALRLVEYELDVSAQGGSGGAGTDHHDVGGASHRGEGPVVGRRVDRARQAVGAGGGAVEGADEVQPQQGAGVGVEPVEQVVVDGGAGGDIGRGGVRAEDPHGVESAPVAAVLT